MPKYDYVYTDTRYASSLSEDQKSEVIDLLVKRLGLEIICKECIAHGDDMVEEIELAEIGKTELGRKEY